MLPDYVKKVGQIPDPVTPQVTRAADYDDGDYAFIFVRASRCSCVDILQPSLCHKPRYPAYLPMHSSALSPTATPPNLDLSMATTPPLTSPGEGKKTHICQQMPKAMTMHAAC